MNKQKNENHILTKYFTCCLHREINLNYKANIVTIPSKDSLPSIDTYRDNLGFFFWKITLALVSTSCHEVPSLCMCFNARLFGRLRQAAPATAHSKTTSAGGAIRNGGTMWTNSTGNAPRQQRAAGI